MGLDALWEPGPSSCPVALPSCLQPAPPTLADFSCPYGLRLCPLQNLGSHMHCTQNPQLGHRVRVSFLLLLGPWARWARMGAGEGA